VSSPCDCGNLQFSELLCKTGRKIDCASCRILVAGRSVWACCAFAQSSYLHHEVIPFRHARRPTGCDSIVSDRILMVTGHFQ
jgi:hypothetical protein